MNTNRWIVLVLLSLIALHSGRAQSAEKSPHGGVLLEIGEEVAHIEMVHDAKAGKLTLYILDGKAEKAEAISGEVKVNLKTSAGPKQLEAKPVDAKDGKASQFEAIDDALKTDKLKGRIALTHKIQSGYRKCGQTLNKSRGKSGPKPRRMKIM
jgi:hypothetical protein